MTKYVMLGILLLASIYYFNIWVVAPVIIAYFLNSKPTDDLKPHTIELSYLQRVEKDKESLNSKIDRLTRFMGNETVKPSSAFLELSAVDQCNLHDQRHFMQQYLQTLEKILKNSQ